MNRREKENNMRAKLYRIIADYHRVFYRIAKIVRLGQSYEKSQ